MKIMQIQKRYFYLLAVLVFTSTSHAQIGEVQRQNRTVIGSVGDHQLKLPYLEFVEITDGESNHYKLWYKNEADPRKGIRNIQFQASSFELSYLHDVFKDGFEVQMQRLEVGEERMLILRPRRNGEPIRVRIFYKDGTAGTFLLDKEGVDNLFGSHKDQSLSFRHK